MWILVSMCILGSLWFNLKRQSSPDAEHDGLPGVVDGDEERRLTDVDVVRDVDDVDVVEVAHLLVGGEVAVATVVVDDDAFQWL